MPIDRGLFAQDCIRQGLYCGVNPHYLLAVAQLRSGISEESIEGQIGVFRLTQEEWNAHCTDTEFDFHFLPIDIRDWDMQVPVFSLMAHRVFDSFVLRTKRNPSAKELYLAQWPTADAVSLSADLLNALNVTSALLGPAADAILEAPAPDFEIQDADHRPIASSETSLDLSSIVPEARREMADKIQLSFQKARMGTVQQAAAIANAIAESNLNPRAHAAIGEDSWGLFQLNRKGGLGKGHNPEDLVNPDFNIRIIIAEAKKYTEFVKATSIDQAISSFVRNVERPKDISGQIVKRIAIASRLIS